MADVQRHDSHRNGQGAKSTRASLLTAKLRQSIVTGALKAGAKLNLGHLRDIYGVSLSPLREALSRLVTTGLVEIEDQRGYRVAPLTVENLAEVVTLRTILEKQAVFESIRHADLDWESAVLGALHRVTRTRSHATDPAAQAHVITAQAAFHAALIANCRMPMTIEMCGTFFDLNARYTYQFGSDFSADPGISDAYASIVEAAVSRDADTATALLGVHIKRTGAALAERTAAALEKPAPKEGSR